MDRQPAGSVGRWFGLAERTWHSRTPAFSMRPRFGGGPAARDLVPHKERPGSQHPVRNRQKSPTRKRLRTSPCTARNHCACRANQNDTQECHSRRFESRNRQISQENSSLEGFGFCGGSDSKGFDPSRGLSPPFRATRCRWFCSTSKPQVSIRFNSFPQLAESARVSTSRKWAESKNGRIGL